ncbi:hypothetical protein [Cryptosporangium sp. NPDC048952]|uniref:hypothetical protein n=1 Tax=Cryptosporangium sp. NPDC048952 TaxID=3363961 RepID=UPI0037174E89
MVDADAVVFDPVLRRAAAKLGSHRPDYFWYAISGDAAREMVVVEVKANSTGRTELIKQLARGAEQVSIPLRLRDGGAGRILR